MTLREEDGQLSLNEARHRRQSTHLLRDWKSTKNKEGRQHTFSLNLVTLRKSEVRSQKIVVIDVGHDR